MRTIGAGMSHREQVTHDQEPDHLHEFTFATYRRLPLLTNAVWREELHRTLDAANQEWRFQRVAVSAVGMRHDHSQDESRPPAEPVA